MTEHTLETIVQKALSEAQKHCVFGFQGGEPTLAGLDFFEKLIAFEKKHNVNKVSISHTIQTNGLLLDHAWANFFRENNFLVGLSIDADKKIHDAFRLDMSGKGTHTRCLSAARLLSKQHVDFNILSVITRQLAKHPESAYRFYKQHDFRHLQFIPCLDGLHQLHGANYYSLDAKTYGHFLCRIFDLWYADVIKQNYRSIRAFDNYIHMLMGYPPESCAMNGVCSTYALIEADGSVYPCDFYAVDEFLLGNVHTHSFRDMLNGAVAETFVAPSRQLDPACTSCEYLPLCRGGCRRDREPMIEGTLSRNRFCQAYQQFFKHALPRMQAIARENLRVQKMQSRNTK
jgi:uncharacterized protein